MAIAAVAVCTGVNLGDNGGACVGGPCRSMLAVAREIGVVVLTCVVRVFQDDDSG